jgi:hypothetical protein
MADFCCRLGLGAQPSDAMARKMNDAKLKQKLVPNSSSSKGRNVASTSSADLNGKGDRDGSSDDDEDSRAAAFSRPSKPAALAKPRPVPLPPGDRSNETSSCGLGKSKKRKKAHVGWSRPDKDDSNKGRSSPPSPADCVPDFSDAVFESESTYVFDSLGEGAEPAYGKPPYAPLRSQSFEPSKSDGPEGDLPDTEVEQKQLPLPNSERGGGEKKKRRKNKRRREALREGESAT